MLVRFLILFCSTFLYISSLFSDDCGFCIRPTTFLEVDTGYRWDKLNNKVALIGPVVGLRTSPQFFKNVKSYQLGGKGLLPFLTNGYIRASGHYGWICSGDYEEGLIFGKIDGHTWDATGGIAWFFPVHCCWGIAPVVGWAYDDLNMEVTDVLATRLAPPTGLVPQTNIDSKTVFQGPWIGVDFLFQVGCDFDLSFGYELHRAKWTERRIPDGPEWGAAFGTTTGFANTRDQCPVWGHIFQLEGTYYFCSCWRLGLALKYQAWQGQNTGRYRRVTTPLASTFTHSLITNLEWNSFSATVQLGRGF